MKNIQIFFSFLYLDGAKITEQFGMMLDDILKFKERVIENNCKHSHNLRLWSLVCFRPQYLQSKSRIMTISSGNLFILSADPEWPFCPSGRFLFLSCEPFGSSGLYPKHSRRKFITPFDTPLQTRFQFIYSFRSSIY